MENESSALSVVTLQQGLGHNHNLSIQSASLHGQGSKGTYEYFGIVKKLVITKRSRTGNQIVFRSKPLAGNRRSSYSVFIYGFSSILIRLA